MRTLKVYIETTLFDLYVDEDAYAHTVKLFKEIPIEKKYSLPITCRRQAGT